MRRRDLDGALLSAALDAGASFEECTPVHGLLRSAGGSAGSAPPIGGVIVGTARRPVSLPSRVVIAADGRRSTLTFGLKMAAHPAPKRWAIGAYFERSGPPAPMGEMHVRTGRYIGVADVPDGLTNVCLVKPSAGGDCEFADPAALLARELAREPLLGPRFGGRPPVAPRAVLGPLAVDVVAEPPDGLILAGDAAGFVDPMTGDGLRFAVGGGELAAQAALDALAAGWEGVHGRLHRARRREFAAKWRFNRLLRGLVARRLGVHAASIAGRVAPSLVGILVARAGDCHVTTEST
jgi:flavin-dependent dehydrogenase